MKGGDFDLVGMLSILEEKAREISAQRIVFDGIDVLLALLDDPIAERRELYRIRDWLSQTGLTGIITQKAGGSEADHRYGFLQFMVDCVVVLRHQVVDGAAFRNLRVVKYRGSGFSGDEFPITLTAEGMQLTHRGPTELRHEVTDERISSGLPRCSRTGACAGGVTSSGVCGVRCDALAPDSRSSKDTLMCCSSRR